MTVDSRNKRAAALGHGRPRTLFPNPDGTLAIPEDRSFIAGAYVFSQVASTNRDRRTSMMAVHSPIRTIFPGPDAQLGTVGDRMHMARLYIGIAGQAAPTIPGHSRTARYARIWSEWMFKRGPFS